MALSDSAANLAFIRDAIGDNKTDSASAYELSTATLDVIYADTTQGNSDLTRTIVWALRRRWGMAINAVGLSGEFGNAQHNQKQEQIKKLLDYWEGVAGMAGGQTISVTATHAYRADSRQTEEPDYSSGTANDDENSITIYF
jgi:hypothetical protein